MTKRTALFACLATTIVAALYFIFSHSPLKPGGTAKSTDAALAQPGTVASPAESVGLAGTNPVSTVQQTLPRESNLGANPYAAALREPGKSKRAWDLDFLKRHQTALAGQEIQFELTEGRMASGTVQITQYREGQLVYLSGELSEPEKGKFFFLTPPLPGKAGKAVGVVEFPASRIAYRIEPTGPDGAP